MASNKDALKKQLFSLIKGTALIHNMSQKDLSHALKTSQPRVSNLMQERKDLFSIDMLVDFAIELGYDIKITTPLKQKDTVS